MQVSSQCTSAVRRVPEAKRDENNINLGVCVQLGCIRVTTSPSTTSFHYITSAIPYLSLSSLCKCLQTYFQIRLGLYELMRMLRETPWWTIRYLLLWSNNRWQGEVQMFPAATLGSDTNTLGEISDAFSKLQREYHMIRKELNRINIVEIQR